GGVHARGRPHDGVRRNDVTLRRRLQCFQTIDGAAGAYREHLGTVRGNRSKYSNEGAHAHITGLAEPIMGLARTDCVKFIDGALEAVEAKVKTAIPRPARCDTRSPAPAATSR